MKAIMVMYDSLNRHYLPNYGCDLAHMPNFQRLGERTVTFDNSYVCSLPCMPARRELHTGRPNFLHRGWTPLEPFDDSMPQLLKENGIYSHLISDHQHYWEDGGATYHTRYQSWEIIRGQEGDPWKANLNPVEGNVSFGPPPSGSVFMENWRRQDLINRGHIREECDFPQAKTFRAGLEFLETNHSCDNWFLQIETFDPHEPFFTPDEYQALYRAEGEPPFPLDWPPYGPLVEPEELVDGVRKKYLALLSMCDRHLGRVLDAMDRYGLWQDTMLIVNTDHGYLLGEHLWWAKGNMPTYNELAHTPLFIWDPRSGVRGERRQALVQSIDLAPTLLDYFSLPIPRDMQGKSLAETIRADTPVREYGLFGFFGAQVNITDGRYLYMRAPCVDNIPLYEYTLMPTLMRSRMPVEKLRDMELADPLPFTKGCPTLKLTSQDAWNAVAPCFRYGDRLYDLQCDPGQQHPLDDPEKELELLRQMARLMRENDAPAEQFVRLGLPVTEDMGMEELLRQREERKELRAPAYLTEFVWEEEAAWSFACLLNMLAGDRPQQELLDGLRALAEERGMGTVTKELVFQYAARLYSPADYEGAAYTMEMASRLG